MLGLAIGGIPAVLVAALVVKSMPVETLRWLVIVVVLYAAAVMLTKLAGSERAAMFQRLAELAEGRLYDQQRAFGWWSAALIEKPAV